MYLHSVIYIFKQKKLNHKLTNLCLTVVHLAEHLLQSDHFE